VTGTDARSSAGVVRERTDRGSGRQQRDRWPAPTGHREARRAAVDDPCPAAST